MASHTRQSQFRRYISLGILAALSSFALPAAQAAGDAQPEGEPSAYVQYRGEPFFLLSDTSFGSNDEAKVRFEVPGRNFSAFAEYGGADIVLYRIADPLEFLKRQKNLHRIHTDGNYVGEGMANAISFIWDDWYRKSRRIFQNIFSSEARSEVTRAVPELRAPASINQPAAYTNQPQYALLPEKNGFIFMQRFRYPLLSARPIQPPAGVSLAGSSSGFGMSLEGNVHIPLGKLQPGLYLVEAVVGGHRATTVVFVSNTVAITKTSAEQMMVWTAHRDNGAPAPDVQLLWTDGVGVLGHARTDSRGIGKFDRPDPEKSYLIGRDAEGGVLISENFYYDSEIYNTKLYAMTDRPLYRPGDEVNVKILGRQFLSARKSEAVAQGVLELQVLDPNGTPVVTQKLQINGQSGAQSVFRLPDNAVAGGYELRYLYKDDTYSAAFRVAEYIKPHFEISMQPDKENFKTNEAVSGKLVLTYPDGKPVKNARVQLTVRAQTTTMVEGEMQYTGLFPVKLQTEALQTDSGGVAKFSLPAAKDPSRYVLTAFATDGAAYRVKATRELLVERSASAYELRAGQQFSQPNAAVRFELAAIAGAAQPAVPVRYDLVKLETQSRSSGSIPAGAREFSVSFADSGSYTVMIYDANGNMLGATGHWVAGDGVKVVKGSIEIVFDRAGYKAGDTAEALITFPEEVDSALLTLERDKVEQSSLLQQGAGWVSASRIAPRQWRAKIQVQDEFAPNMTFSVAYVKHNEWVFQNRGILVEQPRIQLAFKTAREVYQPGETVKVQVQATLDGKPLAASLAVGVVDEMIYVLQPEITPNIFDFFYHPRRNNVRTHSSLQFIGYDMATYRQSAPPAQGDRRERGVKVLERPRRENVDTAYWNGQLNTDANGQASFSFVMPDSLTRWRITGRAVSAQGMVGQRTAYLRSDKSIYAKWISPNWMRDGDAPVAVLAVFNQTDREQQVEIRLSGKDFRKAEALKTLPGINTLSVALEGMKGDTLLAEIQAGKKAVDKVEITLQHEALAWKSPRTQVVAVSGRQTPLNLPRDASNIRVSFASGAAQQFSRIVDDLDDYPYGCVEQTASRMLPLSYALQSLPADSGGERAQITRQLRQRLQHQRLRLVYMAGPNATFGWWGNATRDDLLLTAYAYYADYTASKVLGLNLPAEHWERVLTLFGDAGTNHANSNRNVRANRVLRLSSQEQSEPQNITARALALWMANDMGLPTRTLVGGLLDDLEKLDMPVAGARAANLMSSPALVEPDGDLARALALKLAAQLAESQHVNIPAKVSAALPAATGILEQSGMPGAQALLLMSSRGADRAQAAERILESVRAEMPTFERALTLIWLNKALSGKVAEAGQLALDGAWVRGSGITGDAVWRSKGNAIPAAITLAQEPPKPLTAYVQYDSASAESAKLGVRIERKLYRMAPTGTASEAAGAERTAKFELSAMGDSDAVQSNELYLEEINLTPESGTHVRYGLVEVPLPPGAEVESGTWGIYLADGSALERASNQPARGGYAVPVEKLEQPVVLRHLLRFAQKGRFNLPPARFYSMYAPQLKAFEAMPKPHRVIVE